MNFNIENFNSEEFSFLTYLIIFSLAFLGGIIFRKLMTVIHKLSTTVEHDYILIPIFTISLTTFFYILKSSLPLSLGIVGSLSIIRFRTPIRDLRETFLLISMIAFCLLLGTENLIIAGFFLISLSAIIPFLVKFQTSQKRMILVNITYESGNKEVENYINTEISKKTIISTTVIKNKTYVMMKIAEEVDIDLIKNQLISISDNIEIQYAKN